MAELISDSDKPPLKDISSRLDKIVTQRVGWVFFGICAKGTIFPGEILSKSPGRDVGSTESSAEEWDRYRNNPGDYQKERKLLYYASKIFSKGFEDNNKNPDTIMVARVSSTIDLGMSEVIIAGKATTLDNRGSSVPFFLIQRMSDSASSELFDILRKDPGLFDVYYQKAFPKLDSESKSYTGLWRLIAHKLALLEEEDIKKAFNENQQHRFNINNHESEPPHIAEDIALDLIKKKSVSMDKPTGVGEISEFTPIKNKLNS